MLGNSWANKRRDQLVYIRVSNADKFQMQSIAKSQGLSLSDLLRACLLNTVTQILAGAEVQP